MATFEREQLNQIQHRVSVTLTPDDYMDVYSKELKKYADQGSFKGFRKGKVPMSFVRKMVGKEVLISQLERKFMVELNEYMDKEGLNRKRIFQPIPAPDQTGFDDLDPNHPGDFTLTFDVGAYPDTGIKGISGEDALTRYIAEITDEMVDKQLDQGLDRLAESEEVDGPIEENDMLTIQAAELDGDDLKGEGHTSHFMLPADLIGTEDVRNNVIGKEVGHKFRFNIYTLEKDATREHTLKHLLMLSEEEAEDVGEWFEGTIEAVSRKVRPELNEEFISKYFGKEDITTVEEAKEVIRKDLAKHYRQLSDSVLFFEIKEYLTGLNHIEFPDEFLTRYLQMTQEPEVLENLEQEVERVKDQLQWMRIRNELIEKLEIKVTEEDIREAYKNQVISYFGGNTSQLQPGMLDSLVDRFMQDDKNTDELAGNLVSEKLIERASELFSITEEVLPLPDLEEKLEAQRKIMTGEKEGEMAYKEDGTRAEEAE